MRPYTKIDLNMFNAVKVLLNGGATQREAAEYMKISPNTVYRIAKSESFDEYRNEVYVQGKKTYPKNETSETVKRPEEKCSSSYQLNRIYDALKQQNELLALISNKLAYVVEQLS